MAKKMTGIELKKRRNALKMTQEQLAKELELPLATVARWEADLMTIRHGRLLDLALKYLEK